MLLFGVNMHTFQAFNLVEKSGKNVRNVRKITGKIP